MSRLLASGFDPILVSFVNFVVRGILESGASLSGRKHDAGFLDPASMCRRLFG